MMTIVTQVTIEPGKEPLWDAAFQERVKAVKKQPGWVSVQLDIPARASNQRVVIGTWESRSAWEAWHTTDSFQRTRQRLDDAETGTRKEWWHEVTVDEHR
jgi:heme-degrading monooxygenase HmoA